MSRNLGLWTELEARLGWLSFCLSLNCRHFEACMNHLIVSLNSGPCPPILFTAISVPVDRIWLCWRRYIYRGPAFSNWALSALKEIIWFLHSKSFFDCGFWLACSNLRCGFYCSSDLTPDCAHSRCFYSHEAEDFTGRVVWASAGSHCSIFAQFASLGRYFEAWTKKTDFLYHFTVLSSCPHKYYQASEWNKSSSVSFSVWAPANHRAFWLIQMASHLAFAWGVWSVD